MEEENKLDVVSIRLTKDRQLMSNEKMDRPLVAVETVGRYLADMDREVVCVINCDSSLKPINCSFVSMGALNYSCAVPREIFKSSILSNVNGIVLVHNHPSNDLTPSKEDAATTYMMLESCEILGMTFLDHIIVGTDNERYFSFREKGIIEDIHPVMENDINNIKFSIDEAAQQYLEQNNMRMRRKGR